MRERYDINKFVIKKFELIVSLEKYTFHILNKSNRLAAIIKKLKQTGWMERLNGFVIETINSCNTKGGLSQNLKTFGEST